MEKEKMVDFDKWVRELGGDEKRAWHHGTMIMRDKVRKESDKINRLPAWTRYGWMVGDAHFGKDMYYGGRRRTRKSRRVRKTRRRYT